MTSLGRKWGLGLGALGFGLGLERFLAARLAAMSARRVLREEEEEEEEAAVVVAEVDCWEGG